MKRFLFATVVLSIVLLGCSRTVPGTHIVELYKVFIHPDDFNRSAFDSPLMLRVNFLIDGEPMPFNVSYMIEGHRGERILDKPPRWVIEYSPSKNYQFLIEEHAVVSKRYRYSTPKVPKLGDWPLGRDGTIQVGSKSYFYFRDKVAE